MTNPKPGEVYWVDLGYQAKLRPLLVVSREDPNAERALTICVPLTTAVRGGNYEVPIPRVRWMPGSAQGVAKIQGLSAIENHRLEKRAGRFDLQLMQRVRSAIAWMLELDVRSSITPASE